MVMNILVEVIPHSQQRYKTVGDWFYQEPDTLLIYVSKMENSNYEYLVAIHEEIEARLCLERGITEKEVSAFDIWYEGRRILDDSNCQGEPGDHPQAPYRKEHFFATSIERLIAAELNVDWEKYDEAIQNL